MDNKWIICSEIIFKNEIISIYKLLKKLFLKIILHGYIPN